MRRRRRCSVADGAVNVVAFLAGAGFAADLKWEVVGWRREGLMRETRLVGWGGGIVMEKKGWGS